jgi:hypothetical protein
MSLTVPLGVRLRNALVDRHVTRELRNLVWRETIPGGFESAELSLDRPLNVEVRELAEFTRCTVYDLRNGEIHFDGRLEAPGRGATPEGLVWSVAVAGTARHASDVEKPMLYVDTSLENWFPLAGSTRAVVLGREGQQAGGLNAVIGLGENLADTFSAGWAHSMLIDGDQKLGRVRCDWDAGVTDSDYKVELLVEDAAAATLSVASAAWNTAGGTMSGTKPGNWAASDRYGARIRVAANGVNPPAVPSSVYSVIFDAIVVRALLFNADGTELTTGYTADTVQPYEVVRDLLGRLLPDYDGANAEIDTSGFAINQLAFTEPITPAGVLEQLMMILTGKYWAAWEKGPGLTDPARFEWRDWPITVRYDTSADQGFNSPGSTDELYNAVTVRWRTPAGKVRRNRRTQTVAALDDAGITREKTIDLSDEVGSDTLANQVGDQFLAEHATAPNRGILTVRTPILDLDTMRRVQPWEIRPGHLIRVRDVLPRPDALNPNLRDGVTVFKVITKEYDAMENVATLHLDASPRVLSEMLARAEFRARRR